MAQHFVKKKFTSGTEIYWLQNWLPRNWHTNYCTDADDEQILIGVQQGCLLSVKSSSLVGKKKKKDSD